MIHEVTDLGETFADQRGDRLKARERGVLQVSLRGSSILTNSETGVGGSRAMNPTGK